MSFQSRMSKGFLREEIGGKNRKNKSVMKSSPSLDLNQSLYETDLQLNSFLNSTEPFKQTTPNVSEPQKFNCNFCERKFSNKQALGGHQNAHKPLKDRLKRAREGQIANFGYTGNGFNNVITSFPFPNSLNQVPKMKKGPHYPHYMKHQLHAHGCTGSMFPVPRESGMMQPFVGFGGFCTSLKYPLKPQMHMPDYPGSIFPMARESGAVQPFIGSGFGAISEIPPFMPLERRMGQGTSTSGGRSTIAARTDGAGKNKKIKDKEIQHQEDDFDLSLKL